jgi:hypothetical protein
MSVRYIAIHFGSANIDARRFNDHPGVELYRVSDGPDVEDQVELALLNDLVVPLALAVVGGETAKRLATAYYGTWIEDTPSVNEDLLAFWGCC